MSQTRRFAVVTDSTSDIDPALALERGVSIVPLSVAFGADAMTDGTLTQAEFFERMAREPQLPSTSQPTPALFAEAYERALALAPEVISIHVSNRLSGTIESARLAAAEFQGRVRVFDSLNLSWGCGLQVMLAARLADAGEATESALAVLARARERVRLIVGLDSLDNLAKGGRIGKVSAFLGSMLNFKVTLTVDADGSFQPVARSRGERAAIAHTLDWVAEKMGDAASGTFAVGYALHPERAHRVAEAIRERFDVDELIVYEAGSVICTHTGSGWGVALLPAE